VSTSIQQFADQGQVHERRQNPRILPKSLVYVACGEANGGMVLNASDDGLAISMAIPIADEAFSNVHVRMNGLSQVIEVPGRMVWTTPSRKRAGIQLIDISDYHRQQIREWLALEGVRDVNLVPRTPLDDGVSDHSYFAVDAPNSEAMEQPYPSLLEQFGGTQPESLGPVNHASPPAQGVRNGLEFSQGFESANPIGFSESEWDLAAVTVLPRKKPRPEGLSAFAMALLWIAIPTFGIAMLVGRRPLEQWLAKGDTVGRSPFRNDKHGVETVQGPVNLPLGSGAEPDKHQISQPMTPASDEHVASPDSVVAESTNVTVPVSGSASMVDANLLNSISTQEARALVGSKSVDTRKQENSEPATPDANAIASMNGEPVAQRPIEAPASTIKPTEVPRVALRSNKIEDNLTSSTRTDAPGRSTSIASTDSKNSPKSTSSAATSGDRVSKTLSIDSGIVAQSAKSAIPSSTQLVSSGSVAPANTSSSSAINAPNVGNNSASVPSNLSATATDPGMKATPPAGRPATPAVAPSLAPATSQPALHGVMLVARKSGEGFSLKLPVESVGGGRGASIQMQRYVTVPPQSRWHHRGAVAKLTIGELLTPEAPDAPDAGIRPRDGDTVTVHVFLDKNGSVEDLKLVSGRFALVPRVMRTVRGWQFDQTLVDGNPVESEVDVTVSFRATR
jgi:PilZ domain/Gram-negative bacterial TonB protein C-terminal